MACHNYCIKFGHCGVSKLQLLQSYKYDNNIRFVLGIVLKFVAMRLKCQKSENLRTNFFLFQKLQGISGNNIDW